MEAGLVISQMWAERKRRILLITPANLRKQWHQELSEKFFLPCAFLESRSYNQAIKQAKFRPFEMRDTIVICPYQLARAKAALTELFNEARTAKTPIIVERIVADIDEIVRVVRFPGWQQTIAGEREVQKALRKTLLKYQLHRDQDLFDRAYGYIKQYY